MFLYYRCNSSSNIKIENLTKKLNLVFIYKGWTGHIGRKGVAGKTGDKVRINNSNEVWCYAIENKWYNCLIIYSPPRHIILHNSEIYANTVRVKTWDENLVCFCDVFCLKTLRKRAHKQYYIYCLYNVWIFYKIVSFLCLLKSFLSPILTFLDIII